MSGYSQAAQVFFIFTVLTYGFAATCKIMVSQFWGRNNKENIRTIMGYTLRMAACFSAVFTLLFLLVPTVPMKLFSSDPAVVELGCKYLRVVSLTAILYGMSNCLYNGFGGVERTDMYLYGNVLCYGLNLAFNYVLIFGKLGFPRLGIIGAGIGSLVGRIAEFLYLFITFLRSPEFEFRLSDLTRTIRGTLKRDYYHAFKGMMGHEIIYSVGISMGQIIMGHISTIAVAAYNICYVLFSLVATLSTAFSTACQTAIGKIMGSGELDRARRASRTMLLLTLWVGVISAILMVVFGDLFISLYNVSADTVAYAKGIMPIMAVTAFFTAFEYTALVNIPRAGGDGFTGFIADCITMWCIAIPLAWFAAFKWGLSPVYVIALIKCDMPLKSAIGVIAVLRGKWIKDLTHNGENTGAAATV